MQELARRVLDLLDQAPGFLALVSGPDHVFEVVNRSCARLIGQRSVVGQPLREALPELAGQGLLELLEGVYRTGEPAGGQAVPVSLDGPNGVQQRFIDFVCQPLRDEHGQISGVLCQGHDVTGQVRTQQELERTREQLHLARREGEQRLRQMTDSIGDALQTERRKLARLAHHDALTGVHNRAYLASQFPRLKRRARARGTQIALFYIDLDHFKMINDSRGHRTGDELLCRLAHRLRTELRDQDLFARMGGDEFLALATGLTGTQQADELAERLVQCVREPFEIEGATFCVTASIGTALYPQDGADLDALLQRADIALYDAKGSGRDAARRFTYELDRHVMQRAALQQALQQAVQSEQLSLHYQPIVDLVSGRVTALEALARWHDPHLGEVPPGTFIEIAEQSGLIHELGLLVIRQACRQLHAWREQGHPTVAVSINLSPRQFERPNLASEVRAQLQEFDLPAEQLKFEITESALMQRGARHLQVLQELRAMGSRIAIDDFGVGYSSLSYLKDLPIDALKIDRTFVRDVGTESKGAAVAFAIIKMAQALSLRTIAEGVESAVQLELLRSMGCDRAQGYHIARPMPALDCVAHLSQLDPAASSLRARRLTQRLPAAAG